MTDERLNLTEYDFKVQNEGTLTILHPCNDAAREWIDEKVYGDTYSPQWWGGGIVIEHRFVENILRGVEADGLTLGTL